MKSENKASITVVRALIKSMANEAEAIARCDFSAIADYAAKKAGLADQMEKAFADKSVAHDEALISTFREMQEMARATAVRLQILRDGVARARRRIRDMTAENARIGVYQAKGLPLKARSPAESERSV